MLRIENCQQNARILLRRFSFKQGVIIGETTAASCKVHTLDPAAPGIVYVVRNADAGRVFYGRQREGEIVHLDIFHQVGELNHIRVANCLRQAVRQYAYHRSAASSWQIRQSGEVMQLAHYIDVQTATGGGRITGSLTYGRKLSLRKAHLNHCHIAVKLAPEHYALLFYLVDAVEGEILAQGLELRKIEDIKHEEADSQGLNSLEDYTDLTDSLMRGQRVTADQHYLATASAILNTVTDYEQVKELMAKLRGSWHKPEVDERAREYMRRLASHCLLEENAEGYVRLTTRGEEFRDFLRCHGKELLSLLRRRLHYTINERPGASRISFAEHYARRAYAKTFRSQSFTRERNNGSTLALDRTVIQALLRSSSEVHNLRIAPQDLVYHVKRHVPPLSIVLIVDASASMQGLRSHAARSLAEHLVHSCNDKVAVIVLQENNTHLACGFTRNRHQLKANLERVTPFGLTPLASGLELAVDYLRDNKPLRPWVVLLTDGIPTLSVHSRDPVEEAVEAAGALAELNIPFCCVGLAPHRRILAKIAAAGKGTLYAIDELETDALLNVILSERCAIN